MTIYRQPVIGVDIGGVIIERCDNNADTSFFGKNYLQTPAVPGVLDALNKLHSDGFRIHLVSKCGKTTQRKSLEWLQERDFFAFTGVSPEDVHFCLERHQKAEICDRIGASHFVDDRLEVLSYLNDVPHRYLINAVEKEVRKFRHALGDVVRVKSWEELALKVSKTSMATNYRNIR